MFNFFKENNVDWKAFLVSMENEGKESFLVIVDTFLVPDQIAVNKFIANYKILHYGSRESCKSSLDLLNEPDYSKEATSSIDALAFIIDRPIGYPDWFLAAYPDVVTFYQDLEDEDDKIQQLLKSISEQEVLDGENKFTIKYLRKAVDIYKNSGNKPETSH